MRRQVSIFVVIITSLFQPFEAKTTRSYQTLDSIYQLAFEALETDIEKSKLEGRFLILQSKIAEDNLNLGYAYVVYGLALYYNSELDSAIVYADKAINLFKKTNELEGLSTALFNKSLMLQYLGRYNAAISLLNKGRRIDLKRGAKGESDIFYFSSLSDILYLQDRFDEALVYAQLSLSAFVNFGEYHNYMKARIYLNIAWLYAELDIFEMAEFYAKKTYALSSENKDFTIRIGSLQVLATINSKQGFNVEAIAYLRKALKSALDYKEKSEIIYAKYMLANHLQYSSETLAEAASRWSDIDSSMQGLKDYEKDLSILFDLYKYYKRTDNYPKAIAYLEDYTRINKELNILDVREVQADFEKELAQNEKTIALADLRLQQKDGQLKNMVIMGSGILLTVLIIVLIVALRSGKKFAVLNSSLNKTHGDLKIKEEELRKSFLELEKNYGEISSLNSSKDRLLSILSHDLKQPFNQIIAVLELIEEDVLNTEDRKEIMGDLKSSVEETSTMVNNLLQWSKSQFEGTKRQPALLNLSIVVKRVSLELSVLLKRKSIVIDFAVEESIYIMADEGQLSSIIRNLLSNAYKFSEANSIIYISSGLSSEGKYSLLHLKDKGIGMTLQQVNKILDSNSQLSMPGTNNEMGTGIGMMIVKDFIAQNNGYLEIDSKLGSGSTFTLALPYIKQSDLPLYQ